MCTRICKILPFVTAKKGVDGRTAIFLQTFTDDTVESCRFKELGIVLVPVFPLQGSKASRDLA